MNIISVEPNLSNEEKRNKEQEAVNSIYRIMKMDENLKLIEEDKRELRGA